MTSNSTNKLSTWKLAAFSAPAFAFAGIGSPLSVYVAPYYANELGVGLTLVGAVFMIARFWDMFTDPMLGVLSDKYPTRWGRRRHWMVLGTPIMTVAVILIMFPTSIIGEQVSATYLLGSLFLLYLGFTLLEISHTSWGAELSTDYHERSLIQGWRQFLSLTGVVIVLTIPAVMEQIGFALSTGTMVAAMGWYIVFLLPLTVILAVGVVGEKPAQPVEPIGWRKAIELVFQNKYMARILLADLLIATPGAIRGGIYFFYVSAVIQMPEWRAIIMLSYFFAGPIAVPLWIRISRRIGKHQACAFGVLLHALVTASYLIPGKGDAVLFAVLFFASGVVYGGVPFLLRSITADIIDADKLESGQDRAGLFYSLITMTSKVGGAIGIGIAYPLLDLVGFNPSGTNDQAAIDGLRYVFAFLPLFTELLVVWIVYRFPLDEARQRELRAQIEASEARRSGSPETAARG